MCGCLGLMEKTALPEIKKNVCLAKYTTFHTGGAADFFAVPENEAQLITLIDYFRGAGIPYMLLGGGSNTIVRDGGVEGAVICLTSLKTMTAAGNIITAACGTRLSAAARFAADNSLSGMEFMAGIPGTVGGAVFMNAGAYGSETGDIIAAVNALDVSGSVHTYTAEQLDFSYRRSIFRENGETVLSASFVLTSRDKTEITALMQELNRRRREKQPLEYPSAGSVFKRPQGYYAAALIDEAGLKGLTVGGAQVSEKHAGFIINKGGAVTADIIALIDMVKKAVYDKFKVELCEEVNIVGRDPAKK